MICEIRGTGTHNKGAELMCHVISTQLRLADNDVSFAVERGFGTYEERAQYGFRTMLPERGKWGRARFVTALTRPSYRNLFGLVKRSDLSAVLDASGFAFSDQWGLKTIQNSASLAERARDSGIPFILLPQALGPFTKPGMRVAAKRLFEAATLVFPREQTSLDYVLDLGISGDKVIKAHDFTVLAKGIYPNGLELPEKFSLIVPNARMLDRTDSKQSRAYVDFMATVVKDLRTRELNPHYLFHDWNSDSRVADAIDERSEISVPRLAYRCPLELKGIIGRSELIVGSRFHALVGALCQGVPVLATGWSHKYEELLGEYGIPEFITEPVDSNTAKEHLLVLADDSQRQAISKKLRVRSKVFQSESVQMFACVQQKLGLSARSAS